MTAEIELTEKAFDEFLKMAFKYKGPPKHWYLIEQVTIDGVVWEPGHYRLTDDGYEAYDPEDQDG